MAGVNPGGISRSNIGITWGHGWMALLAKHTKLIILCLHAKKLIYHAINLAKMVILWVNIRVRPPPNNFTNAHLGFTMRNNKSLLLNQSGIFRRRQIWFPTPGQSFGDGFPLVAVTSFLNTQAAEPNARMTATWAEFHIPNPQAHYQITHAFRFQPSCVLSTWNSLTHAGNTGPVKLWISIPVATGTTQQLSKLIE